MSFLRFSPVQRRELKIYGNIHNQILISFILRNPMEFVDMANKDVKHGKLSDI